MHTNEKYELLLSAISHEIRNPVTLINSYLQLISSAHPEVGTFEYWNTVGEEMQHLKTLLGDLSLFNNSMKIHPISLDLNKWMHAYGIHGEAFLHCLTGDHPDKMTFTTLIASICLLWSWIRTSCSRCWIIFFATLQRPMPATSR